MLTPVTYTKKAPFGETFEMPGWEINDARGAVVVRCEEEENARFYKEIV